MKTQILLLAIDLNGMRIRCEVAMWGSMILAFLSEIRALGLLMLGFMVVFFILEKRYARLYTELCDEANNLDHPPTR